MAGLSNSGLLFLMIDLIKNFCYLNNAAFLLFGKCNTN